MWHDKKQYLVLCLFYFVYRNEWEKDSNNTYLILPASFEDHQLRNMAITKSSPTSVKKMLCSVTSLFFLLAALFMSANAQQTPTISYITPNLLSKVKQIKNTLYLRITLLYTIKLWWIHFQHTNSLIDRWNSWHGL